MIVSANWTVVAVPKKNVMMNLVSGKVRKRECSTSLKQQKKSQRLR